MTVKVVLADDHTLVREGVRRFLESSGEFQVLGEASTGQEIVDLAVSTRPDVAVLDIRMPEMDGLEAARAIRDRSPDTAVVMLTAYDDRHFVGEAVRAGARGYVLKVRDAEHLVETLRLVTGGKLVIDPELVRALAEELEAAQERDQRGPTLTEREVEILQHVAFGKTNREVGEKLYIAVDTVKTHLEHIYQKLGTNDRTAAVAEALRRRLID
ncbi:MAG TPA: response regulator transcription factor [Actinomycetota bacterium]|nr:response regulator transcription factor [Actinomycetota bacterium]